MVVVGAKVVEIPLLLAIWQLKMNNEISEVTKVFINKELSTKYPFEIIKDIPNR